MQQVMFLCPAFCQGKKSPPGYLEVYVNNEAQTPVYYDNLQSTGNVIEVNAYYPYGKIIQGLSTSSTYGKNNYKYNAKELQTELNLNWGDHGARMADYTIGRWWVPDPLGEKYYSWSPYNYCLNNPIKYIDPDGKGPTGPPAFYWVKPEQSERVGKAALRYFTPVEDILAIFTGKNFDGQSYNRAEATGWAAMGFIPFGKIIDKGSSLIKVAFKYSDEVADIVKATGKISEDAKEIITVTKSGKFSDALKVTEDIVGDLGKDAKDYVAKAGGEKNPFYNKVVGKQSADGKKYWRIDVDAKTGDAHINWVNGKQKGSIQFDGGFDQAKRIIDNEVFK